MITTEPDTYCKHNQPVVWGFLGFSDHSCDECIKESFVETMIVLKKTHEDHQGIFIDFSEDISELKTHCDECIVTRKDHPASNWPDGEFEAFTEYTCRHPLSVESVKLINVVMLPEADKWGSDIIFETLYAEGTEWSGRGATYGFNSNTQIASCYAD